MTDQQFPPTVARQQEIVNRYAVQLRQAACGAPRRPTESTVRRCYELLNQCAMELAEANRSPGGAVTAATPG
jgi:hypothetical protein